MATSEDSRMKADILLVDDQPDQLLALESVLAGLDQNVTLARSGKEALRLLLQKDFAIIVLDVNMPVMDGYETAALIRERRKSMHTPIIFVSAYPSSDTHVSRGYSLGAVDYIQRPIVPDVLRAKVSAFVELHKKREQLHQMLVREQQRAAQLRQLVEATLEINSALSIEQMLEVVTRQARRTLGARFAAGRVATGADGAEPVHATSWPDDDRGHGGFEFDMSKVEAMLRGIDGVVRFGSAAVAADSSLAPRGQGAGAEAPVHACLAAPLTGRKGGNVGHLQVCGKQDGPFTAEDEFMLIHLAQTASLAITKALYFEARETNRLKDEFLATLSHELRTPLTAILGWAWIAREKQGDAALLTTAMEVIERNARVQVKLIDDLLDISRVISGKLRLQRRPLQLQAVVATAVDALRPVAEAAGVRLTVQLDPQAATILGDPDRLQQAVTNLVSNAIKFTPDSGAVDVRLERQGDAVRLSVDDTGVGISPDFLPHVFERFRQADATTTRSQGGLGLGLAIVRHLVELHDGTVEAHSEGRGKGASFRIHLPLAPAGEEAGVGPAPADADPGATPRLDPPADAPVSLQGLSILLVDDETDSRRMSAALMRHLGASVVEAGSAHEALAVLASQSAPGVDVVVSDLAMPGTDGFGLVRALREHANGFADGVPALALTAFARPEDRARALAAGFQGYLAKPVAPHRLAAAIAALRAERGTARR